jgi:hypothetical protein
MPTPLKLNVDRLVVLHHKNTAHRMRGRPVHLIIVLLFSSLGCGGLSARLELDNFALLFLEFRLCILDLTVQPRSLLIYKYMVINEFLAHLRLLFDEVQSAFDSAFSLHLVLFDKHGADEFVDRLAFLQPLKFLCHANFSIRRLPSSLSLPFAH